MLESTLHVLTIPYTRTLYPRQESRAHMSVKLLENLIVYNSHLIKGLVSRNIHKYGDTLEKSYIQACTTETFQDYRHENEPPSGRGPLCFSVQRANWGDIPLILPSQPSCWADDRPTRTRPKHFTYDFASCTWTLSQKAPAQLFFRDHRGK